MELHPFLRKLGFTPDGTMSSREVNPETIVTAVREDPDAAARFVLGVVAVAEPPSAIAQMAMVIAGAYQIATDDDSLSLAVANAPWARKIKPPVFLNPDRKPVPREHEDPFRPMPGTLRMLEVVQSDIDSGDVTEYVQKFSFEGKSNAEKKRMASTWGSWSIGITTEDERPVLVIPGVRRFISRIHEAMPYFPAYLDYRKELAMFWVYFGSVADADAVSNNGLNLDLRHPTLLLRVSESLSAIGVVAKDVGQDPVPLWRGLLSGAYPPRFVTDMIGMFQR